MKFNFTKEFTYAQKIYVLNKLLEELYSKRLFRYYICWILADMWNKPHIAIINILRTVFPEIPNAWERMIKDPELRDYWHIYPMRSLEHNPPLWLYSEKEKRIEFLKNIKAMLINEHDLKSQSGVN